MLSEECRVVKFEMKRNFSVHFFAVSLKGSKPSYLFEIKFQRLYKIIT